MEQRYIIILFCFFATFAAYSERVGFSIAFTELAKQSQIGESQKGNVLSLFYWGYGLSLIPAGYVAQKYGGKIVLQVCFLSWATLSILTPVKISNLISIYIVRLLVGVAQGFLVPSVHTVLSQWIPPHERARAVSLAMSGMYLGSASAMLVLPSVSLWPGPGYITKFVGLFGMIWLALWSLFSTEVPHREQVIPIHKATNLSADLSKVPPKPTPTRRMMSHPALLTLLFSNFAFHYSLYVVMNWLPTYFQSLLKADLSKLGPIKAVPYITMFIMSNVGGWGGDWLISKSYATASARKTVNTIGFIGIAVFILCMPLANNAALGVLITTCTLAACGFTRGGFSVNHMDIAPKYAGVVMGIQNTAGTVAGVIGVALTGALLDMGGGAQNPSGWFMSSFVAAVIGIMAAVHFIIFGKGEKLFD